MTTIPSCFFSVGSGGGGWTPVFVLIKLQQLSHLPSPQLLYSPKLSVGIYHLFRRHSKYYLHKQRICEHTQHWLNPLSYSTHERLKAFPGHLCLHDSLGFPLDATVPYHYAPICHWPKSPFRLTLSHSLFLDKVRKSGEEAAVVMRLNLVRSVYLAQSRRS